MSNRFAAWYGGRTVPYALRACNGLPVPSVTKTVIKTHVYWNGHNLFVQPASSRLFVRISGVH